eukprot:6836004-Pyramimonas_sp.AAC.1
MDVCVRVWIAPAQAAPSAQVRQRFAATEGPALRRSKTAPLLAALMVSTRDNDMRIQHAHVPRVVTSERATVQHRRDLPILERALGGVGSNNDVVSSSASLGVRRSSQAPQLAPLPLALPLTLSVILLHPFSVSPGVPAP